MAPLDSLDLARCTGGLTKFLAQIACGITMDSMVSRSALLHSPKLTLDLGLIRFKMVVHAFIDGKSRVVTGIRVSNNNRADTVLDVFMHATRSWGIPSCVRGDHGGENIRVAEWMEENRGRDRGSYIWGPCVCLPPICSLPADEKLSSVHNTRIERLWFDLTQGFGQKWKDLFLELETHHGLNPTDPDHIWLLHHLFLQSVDKDAQQWAQAWNRHKIQLSGEPNASPSEMWFWSQLNDGIRGINDDQTADDLLDDPDSFGIDWVVHEDERIMAHFRENNARQETALQLTGNVPRRLSIVHCNSPDSPLPPHLVAQMDDELTDLVDLQTRDMDLRRRIWIRALSIFLNLLTV
jgi:hypothetical protein